MVKPPRTINIFLENEGQEGKTSPVSGVYQWVCTSGRGKKKGDDEEG
jgi:hypothetical protein